MIYCTNQLEQDSYNAYDYIRGEEGKFKNEQQLPLVEGHYEMGSGSGNEPFCEPAGVEDELKKQLQHVTLTQEQDTLS